MSLLSSVEKGVAADVSAMLALLEKAVGSALLGKPQVIRLALTALLARGHLLIEDVPGVGKTTLACALARAVGGGFQRVQFTADLLPSDLIGVSVFDQHSQRFRFQPGPVFAHVLLADEINRATPKTQSALLEAMSEHRVSVDGTTYDLPDPFFVVATQNPLDHHGTFPLPDSQMDRFMMRISIGYPDAEEEKSLLASSGWARLEDEVSAVIESSALTWLQQSVAGVEVQDSVLSYANQIVRATRSVPGVAIGVSPRGALALMRASRAYALLEGRSFVTPDDIKSLAVPTLAHRLILAGSDGHADQRAAEEIIREVMGTIRVPR